MGKKAKEYKTGDFIFAKVKGYPAWPARVQRQNGKKYFVYFYGTGETANLPANMIFDYAENKDKFLTKNVKRRDFNDGVKQIEHDFVNNVPLDQVIGAMAEAAPAEGADDTANDTGNDTMEDSAIDTTAADDTVADTTASTQNATQNDTAVEDSDETGALVIDEGKGVPPKQPRKSKAAPVPEPAKTPKTPKTPRGRPRKDEEEDKAGEKEEIVSRSGRKIRPKRYIDEQTEENATLPSPASKKRRGASPAPDKEKEKEAPKEKKEEAKEKNIKHFNNVPQLDLEDLKEPFKPADADKDNILIAYLPSGQYCGIKLFQSRPASFKDDAAKLQWDKRAAANAITLKGQLERGQITAQSIITQLVMDLNLTDEEKASLDKERETEEKKSRVQFLKTEMKLIELDAKIKTCLSLEKADVETCLKLLDELMELDIKPLMLLKHPCCVETVKRMRAYVGNAPRWQLSEPDALLFASRAHTVRKQADTLYKQLKELFPVPEGLSFWEHFSALLTQFQQATASLSADQLLEMVRPPLELSQPSAVTMQAAIDAANKEEPPLEEDEVPLKKKNAKAKKSANNNTPAKQAPKRQSSRTNRQEEKEKDKETDKKQTENDKVDEQPETESQNIQENNKDATETNESPMEVADSTEKDVEEEPEKANEKEADEVGPETNDKQDAKDTNEADQKEQSDETPKDSDKNSLESDNKSQESEKKSQESDKKSQESDKKSQESEKKSQESEKKSQDNDKKAPENDKKSKESSKKPQDSEKKTKDVDKKSKESEKKSQENDKEKSNDVDKESTDHGRETRKDKKKELEDKQKEKEDEPRAKRSRGENKKTEPPPRSPAKRKSKA